MEPNIIKIESHSYTDWGKQDPEEDNLTLHDGEHFTDEVNMCDGMGNGVASSPCEGWIDPNYRFLEAIPRGSGSRIQGC